jgi:hypothetical protein
MFLKGANMPNTFTNVTSAVTQKNAHQVANQMVAFINANGGVAKWALLLNKNAFTANNTLFGGVNSKGYLWQPMLKAQQTQNSVAGAILWACVNGANINAINKVGKTTCPKAHAKLVNMQVPTVAKPIPLTQIQAIHQLSGSSVLANGNSQQGCRQNALCATLIGSFSYLPKATMGTNFATLVPLAS